MERQIVTNSEDETVQLGRKFARILNSGSIVALIGDLSAGKTTFIKGICDELGVEEDVGSPTFTLINEYNGELPVYHIDCYREQNVRGWIDIGIEEYLYGSGITLIEWAEMLENLLPAETIRVEIEQDFCRKSWRAFNFVIPAKLDIEQEELARL